MKLTHPKKYLGVWSTISHIASMFLSVGTQQCIAKSQVLRQWGWTKGLRHFSCYYQQLSQLNFYYLASAHNLYFSFSYRQP